MILSIRKITCTPNLRRIGLIESFMMTYIIKDVNDSFNYLSWKTTLEAISEQHEQKYS